MSKHLINYYSIAQSDFQLIEKTLGLSEPFYIDNMIDVNATFEGALGYRTRNPLQIFCFQSKESKKFEFEIAKGFQVDSAEKPILSFYRYSLRWYYDTVRGFDQTTTLRDDYLHECIITLKRSIRFDYHPNINTEDPLEKQYHWHPNGCSEIKKATARLEPIHAIAFGAKFFAPKLYENCSETIRAIVEDIL